MPLQPGSLTGAPGSAPASFRSGSGVYRSGKVSATLLALPAHRLARSPTCQSGTSVAPKIRVRQPATSNEI